MIFFLTL